MSEYAKYLEESAVVFETPRSKVITEELFEASLKREGVNPLSLKYRGVYNEVYNIYKYGEPFDWRDKLSGLGYPVWTFIGQHFS